jgi:hypothetical protein
MPKIVINSSDAKLNHVNQRYEGNKAAPVLALDLKFECVVDGAFQGEGNC